MRADRHGRGSARAFLRKTAAWMRGGFASASSRGIGFWLVTALLGLLLPAPVAVVVVAARLRRPGAGRPERRPAG